MGRHSKPGVIPDAAILGVRIRRLNPWPVVVIDDMSWIDSPDLEDKIRQIDEAFRERT